MTFSDESSSDEFSQLSMNTEIQARLKEIKAQAQNLRKLSSEESRADSKRQLESDAKHFTWWMPILALVGCILVGSGFYYWDAYHFAHNKAGNDTAITQLMQAWIISLNEKNYDGFSSLDCLSLRNSPQFDNLLSFEQEITQGRRKLGAVNFVGMRNIHIRERQAQAILMINYSHHQSNIKEIKIQLVQEFGQWKSCSITPQEIYLLK